jgi:hypothetical protein
MFALFNIGMPELFVLLIIGLHILAVVVILAIVLRSLPAGNANATPDPPAISTNRSTTEGITAGDDSSPPATPAR